MPPIPHSFQGDQALHLLADPANYFACRWDLRAEPAMRKYWLGLFRDHFPSLLEEAAREAADRGLAAAQVAPRLQNAKARFEAYLDALAADPGRDGRLDILTICIERERILRRASVDDPYRLPKSR